MEGGRFARSPQSEVGSAIYYLLVAPEFSAPHRLDRVELFGHHAGAPTRPRSPRGYPPPKTCARCECAHLCRPSR